MWRTNTQTPYSNGGEEFLELHVPGTLHLPSVPQSEAEELVDLSPDRGSGLREDEGGEGQTQEGILEIVHRQLEYHLDQLYAHLGGKVKAKP